MTHLLLIIIYIAFISLGLPDALLGSAWPSIYPEFAVPVSYAGIISMIIALGTIFSSLQSDRLTVKYGTGKITAASVGMTAAALFGFSISHSFVALCLWAIPYGLGAGSVDASLNNYVALHYKSRHMSWLHCMWGIGASVGPYIMGAVLTGGMPWNNGYRVIAVLQVVLTAILVFSLPLWKSNHESVNLENSKETSEDTSKESTRVEKVDEQTGRKRKALSLSEIFSIPGAKAIMVSFFCYCAIEQTAGLWAASYLTLQKGLTAELAASFASMFFLGITAGRALSGFLTIRWNDRQMVRLGQGIIALGVVVMLLPFSSTFALIGLILIGLGCAPIYPCMLHATPEQFGADQSQAIIGVEMASAYVGTCVMPPLFGVIANAIGIGLLPIYILAILILMVVMFEKVKGGRSIVK
ncbi:MAG: MFS transporter [Eubacteriales bacterium]|nr:MFS transporter [Eubacteriales bacterium]